MKYLNGFFLFVKAFFPMRLTFPCYFELDILHHLIWILLHLLLREKCPNTELFLVCIFPHSNWIRRDTPYSVRMRENTDQQKFRSVSCLRTRLTKILNFAKGKWFYTWLFGWKCRKWWWSCFLFRLLMVFGRALLFDIPVFMF